MEGESGVAREGEVEGELERKGRGGEGSQTRERCHWYGRGKMEVEGGRGEVEEDERDS